MRILACFGIFLWLGLPATAGGLFSSSNFIQGSVANALESPGARVAPSPAPAETTVKSATKALEDYNEQLAKPRATTTRSLTLAPSYETLQSNKTPDQRKLEEKLTTEYGQPVSNICLTAAGACEVSYSTHGSTCFCSQDDTFELGIVQ